MLDGIAEIIAELAVLLGAVGALLVVIRRGNRRAIDAAAKAVDRLGRTSSPLWAFIDNLPLPCWCKDTQSRMQWINAQYSVQWNIYPHRYEGQLDSAIWPPDVARAFVEHDRRVIAERVVLETTEEVPDIAGDLRSTRRIWRIWKFPIFDPRPDSDDVIGVGGFAAPLSLTLPGYKYEDQRQQPAPLKVDPTASELKKWKFKNLDDHTLAMLGKVAAGMLGVKLLVVP